MGMSYLAISAASTVLSFVGLQLWTEFSIDKLRTDGLLDENIFHLEIVNLALGLILGSYATIALLANFVLNFCSTYSLSQDYILCRVTSSRNSKICGTSYQLCYLQGMRVRRLGRGSEPKFEMETMKLK